MMVKTFGGSPSLFTLAVNRGGSTLSTFAARKGGTAFGCFGAFGLACVDAAAEAEAIWAWPSATLAFSAFVLPAAAALGPAIDDLAARFLTPPLPGIPLVPWAW